jgi:hypothetical protein
MFETPVFTGDFGFSRAYELRNSGLSKGCPDRSTNLLTMRERGSCREKEA